VAESRLREPVRVHRDCQSLRRRGSNNGSIPYSLRELADALNVGKATAMRATKRLQEHGFIVEMKRGAFSLKLRHATEWRLTEFGCDVTGALPSREYRHWKKQNAGSEMKPNGFCGETERVSDMKPCPNPTCKKGLLRVLW
jgi:DNA-binding transcriptional MocR family regulator